MSRVPGGPDNLSPGDAPQANPAMVRRRPASVQLRGTGTGDAGSMMDPANQSLADALRITYRIIQLAMLGLVVAYFASGFQSIKLTETGLRVLFGRAEYQPLPPGFAFSLPTPMGEIIKVDTSAQSYDMDREFFQNVGQENRRKSVDQLESQGKNRLSPLNGDGQNLTGDLSIAHTRWKIQYQRTPQAIRDYVTNVDPALEEELVIKAVMRGVVQAVSQVTIDELLRAQPEPTRKGPLPLVDLVAKQRAQAVLDEMKSGITITNLDLESRTPPLVLRKDFAAVDASKAEARRAAEKAQQEKSAQLTATAGDAWPMLLKLINQYDAALATSDAAKGEAVIGAINDYLDGKPVTVEGTTLPVLRGQASGLMNDASQSRASAITRASADLEVYRAKLAIYKQNPRLLVSGEWSGAFTALMTGPNKPTIWWVPAGAPIDLWLNTDPELQKIREMEAMRQRTNRIQMEELKTYGDMKFNNLLNPTTTVKE